jgi:phage FluMu protein Com
VSLIKSSCPECPACGCNATTLIGAGEKHGRPWAKFRCDFCACQFGFGRNPDKPRLVNGVTYRKLRCPSCDSKNTTTTSTRQPVRFHKCNNCGQNFKSVEEP